VGFFRFRRSIKIFPGIRLNIGKKSASVSVGVRGAHVTMGTKGTRTTLGIPGTGLSYTEFHRGSATPIAPLTSQPKITVSKNGEKLGPYTREEINAFLGSGELNLDDWAWPEGVSDWVPLGRIAGIGSNPPSVSVIPSETVRPYISTPTAAPIKSGCGTAIMKIGIATFILMLVISIFGSIFGRKDDGKKTTQTANKPEIQNTSGSSKGGSVYVHGYRRKDGTYVNSHTRRK